MSMDATKTTYEVEGLDSFTDEYLHTKDIRIITRVGNKIKLLYDQKAYEAVIKDFDPETKRAWINVSGFDFRIKINEPLDKLIHELGFLRASKHSVKEIKSPMPGLVVNFCVNVGETVVEGDKLLSLEAMKMENIMNSSSDGGIKTRNLARHYP